MGRRVRGWRGRRMWSRWSMPLIRPLDRTNLMLITCQTLRVHADLRHERRRTRLRQLDVPVLMYHRRSSSPRSLRHGRSRLLLLAIGAVFSFVLVRVLNRRLEMGSMGMTRRAAAAGLVAAGILVLIRGGVLFFFFFFFFAPLVCWCVVLDTSAQTSVQRADHPSIGTTPRRDEHINKTKNKKHGHAVADAVERTAAGRGNTEKGTGAGPVV